MFAKFCPFRKTLARSCPWTVLSAFTRLFAELTYASLTFGFPSKYLSSLDMSIGSRRVALFLANLNPPSLYVTIKF